MATLCLGPVCIPVWHVLAILAFLLGPCYRWILRRRGLLTDSNVTENSFRPTTKLEVTSWENVANVLESIDINTAFGGASRTRMILIKYSADWCKPCKLIQPFVEKMNKCFRCLVLTVDITKTHDMADVNCMPTFRLYAWNPANGPLIKERPGLGMTLVQEVMGASTQGIIQMLNKHCQPYEDSRITDTSKNSTNVPLKND